MAMVTARSRVEDLVPGDLSAIASARDMLGSGIAPVQGAAATLTGLQVQGWKGVAADRFALVAPREAQKVSVLPGAFSRSASAMSRWESAFIAARAQAAEAVRLAARADALTAQSRSDYQAAVASAQVASVPVTSPTQPVTFVDRGATFNAQAQATLATALSSLKAVESEVASAIRPTAGWPPADPEDRNGWDKVLFFASDFIWTGVIGGVVELGVGLAEAGWWVFETFDPFRFVVDQINGGQQWSDAWWANFSRRFGEVGDTLGYVVTHPGEIIGALLADFFAVDLWANEPGAALGRVLLNVVLLASGVGAVAKGVKGVTITAKAAQAERAVPTINWGQQAKHIPGHQGYLAGRSQLTANPELLAQRAGTGQQVGSVARGESGFRARIDYGENIGTYIDMNGNAYPTSVAILHYKSDGSIHIVPGRPAQ